MIKQELPVANEIPPKKDLKLLIREKKRLIQIIAGVFFAVVVISTVGIASWIILSNSKGPVNSRITSNDGSNPATNTTSLIPRTIRPPMKIEPTLTPTPMPFPNGPQIYSVSSKNKIIVKELYISNLNTKIGDSTTLTLTIQDDASPITSVAVTIKTDKKSSDHILTKTSGTTNNGKWGMTWAMDDTHGYNYQAVTTIKDQAGNVFTFTPSFR